MPFSAPALPLPRVFYTAGVSYARGAKQGALVITRRDLRTSGRNLTGADRVIARIPGTQGEDEAGTMSKSPTVSPDGTRLAVTCGTGMHDVPAGTAPLNGREVPVTKSAGSRHLVLIVDTRSGRLIDQAAFEGRVEFAWSGHSNRLGVLALDKEYKRSTVYVLGDGKGRRLVQRDAVRFLWAGDDLLTATWRSHGGPAFYGEMFQALGERWPGHRVTIRKHSGGRVRTVSLFESGRLLGVPHLSDGVWSPSSEFLGIGRPLTGPGDRSLFLFKRYELVPGTNLSRLVDALFDRGKPMRLQFRGVDRSDGGNGLQRAWNLGHGVVAYASTGQILGNDGPGFAAYNVRTRTKRYWSPIEAMYTADYEIYWR